MKKLIKKLFQNIKTKPLAWAIKALFGYTRHMCSFNDS